MTAYASSAWNGLGDDNFSISVRRPVRPYGCTWPWHGIPDRSLTTPTTSPAFGNLRKCFRAAVRDLTLACSDFPGASVAPAAQPSIFDLMRQDINEIPQGTVQSAFVDPAVDIPVVESLSPLIISSTAPLPVVDAPVRSLPPNNRSLSHMQSGSADQPQLHV